MVVTVVIVVTCVGLTVHRPAATRSASRPAASRSAFNPARPPAPFDIPLSRLSVEERSQLAAALGANVALERDVAFLLAVSIEHRCNLSLSKAMTRLALQTRLPVLEAASRVLNGKPRLRRLLYEAIIALASAAPCHRPIHMALQPFQLTLDPDRYALRLPDSFFDPALVDIPSEFAGRSVQTRANEPCTPLAYGVLPLGGQQPWECTGLRAGLRAEIQNDLIQNDLCRSVIAKTPRTPATSALQAELASRIHARLSRLPDMCQ